MIAVKLSINKICMAVFAILVLLSGSMTALLYLLTRDRNVIWCGLLFSALILFCVVLLIAALRRRITAFSSELCRLLDNMLTGEMEPPQASDEENLFYKINHRLARLYEVMLETRRSIEKERMDLQELISDISHQVKTPIASLKMVNSTLLEQSMPEEKQREFLTACNGQLDKLDFLMQAMIKTSRLETGIISLEMKEQPVYDTLAAALGGILLNAELKHIEVSVDCAEKLAVLHDRKWTSEALFNILDNAVKYTPESGDVRVYAEDCGLYVKIDIADSGKGIPENRQGAIFKRFYREQEVHDTPGIGIGLYLAREIITRQGGYIRVKSKTGEGTVFSVFLPRR